MSDSLRTDSNRILIERAVLFGFAVVLLVVSLSGACLGATRIAPGEVVRIVGGAMGLVDGPAPAGAAIVLQLRLPRVVLGVLVGAMLAVGGAAAQGLFRNPLAEPGLIGISNGAVCGVLALLVLGGTLLESLPAPVGVFIVPIAAFAGALASAAFVHAVSAVHGGTASSTLILAGIAINAFSGAVSGIFFFFANDAQLRSATFWTLGSLGGASWSTLTVAAPLMLLCMVALMFCGRRLDALQLGDAQAEFLGLHVRRLKHGVMLLVALGVAAAVSLTGLIAFVGLVVPHLVRLALGPGHRTLLPASALLGASLLVLADLGARTLAAPAEIPIGVLTSVIGAPFFLWLLLRSRREAMEP